MSIMKHKKLSLAVLTACTLVAVLHARAADKSQALVQPQWVSQLIVKERGTSAADTLDVASATQRWAATAQLPLGYKRPMSTGAHVVMLPKAMSLNDAATVAKRMEASGQFDYVSPDRKMSPAATITDPLFSQQWNLMPTSTAAGGANITNAWGTTKGSALVTVGIVDTGLIATHADLSGAAIRTGYDFVSSKAMTGTPDPKTGLSIPLYFVENDGSEQGRDADPSDPGSWVSSSDAANYPTFCGAATNSDWHGTLVTGLIAAQQNTIGIAGIAPATGVLMARALGKCGGVSSDIIDAMTWAAGGAVQNVPVNTIPAKIVNMSLGGFGSCTSAEQAGVNAVRALGASVIVATGNEAGLVDSPANCSGVIAVTAHTIDGDRASYANVGAQTTLSAPGGGYGMVLPGNGSLIPSLFNNGTQGPTTDAYAQGAGTSFATPHVSGVAALMLALVPTLTPDQVATLLKQSSRPFPAGTYCATHAGMCGSGMLDGVSALLQTQGKPTLHAAKPAAGATANAAVTLSAVGGPGFETGVTSVVWNQTAGTAVTVTSSGPDANGAISGVFTPPSQGTYSFNVTLTNSAGATATDSVTLSVAAAAPTSTGTPSTGTSSTGTSGGTTTSTSSGSGGGGTVSLPLSMLLVVAGMAAFVPRRRGVARA
ncbi:S8 family serine peptidase [Ralstonia sp. UBA689]|uniref:S8 family serine peptidase n=1 Tax=Ralstonia sp. UBA689 TaxID=1947373 RepID=UPI0025CEE8E2|nr:S8 family serine peptidase [Ralstonia sp. UBA689]